MRSGCGCGVSTSTLCGRERARRLQLRLDLVELGDGGVLQRDRARLRVPHMRCVLPTAVLRSYNMYAATHTYSRTDGAFCLRLYAHQSDISHGPFDAKEAARVLALSFARGEPARPRVRRRPRAVPFLVASSHAPTSFTSLHTSLHALCATPSGLEEAMLRARRAPYANASRPAAYPIDPALSPPRQHARPPILKPGVAQSWTSRPER
jgi:hypothetical protein